MANVVEIRWHARGGQGAKTACELLAEAAFNTGKFVQGFPEYGPERMGAPIAAYNRISDDKIRIHSNIYEPDFAVVLDESLIECVDLTAGLKDTGAIIINTARTPEAVIAEHKAELGGYKGRVCTIDARHISEECLGRYFPNTPLLAAIVSVAQIMDTDAFLKEMEEALTYRFGQRTNGKQVIEGNLNAFKRAISEVKG